MADEKIIDASEYQDDTVIIMLKLWGEWYRDASRLPNLGYPKSVPFIWERSEGVKHDSVSFVDEYGVDEAIPLLIHGALKMNRVFRHVAEITYAFNPSGTSTKEKARQLRHRNVYLGSSLDSCRKKYTELENNLHSFIQGYIVANEINL